LIVPIHLADPFVADEEIADRAADVVARVVERAAAARREVEEAESIGVLGDCASATDSIGIRRASRLNE
jgi:hypothetical protein